MPAGFRRAVGSGLILPEAISRVRQVWTKDEGRLLDRAFQLFTAKGMRAFLKCEDPACASAPIEKIRTPDGGVILRCAHSDRVFTKAF